MRYTTACMPTISADVEASVPSNKLPSKSRTANVSGDWLSSELTPVISIDWPSGRRTLELPWLLCESTPTRTSKSAVETIACRSSAWLRLMLGSVHCAVMARTSSAAKARVPVEQFNGFSDEAIQFFLELQAEQSRTWFKAHQDDFVRLWRRPLELFVFELRERLSDEFQGIGEVEPHFFRIQRDTRFARDKTPYKTYVAADMP